MSRRVTDTQWQLYASATRKQTHIYTYIRTYIHTSIAHSQQRQCIESQKQNGASRNK